MNNQELEQELKERINAVEDGLPGLSRMTRKDYIMVAIVSALCFVGIIAGAFLYRRKQGTYEGKTKRTEAD